MNTRDLNETLRSLNMGLPDDVERLKAAGYYEEAIARIDAYLLRTGPRPRTAPTARACAPTWMSSPRTPPPTGWTFCGTL